MVSISLLLMYSIITGSSTSTIRAVIMLSVMIIANVVQRTYDSLSAVALSATILLLLNPFQLYDSSFILSFSAVLSIIIIPTKINQTFHPKSKLLKLLIASLSITLGTLPITAFLFFELPMYSTLLNLIVIPLMSLLIPIVIVSLLLNPILSFACVPFVYVAEGILELYEILCNGFIRLPCSENVVGKPSLWMILVYYMVLFFILFIKDFKKTKITVVTIGLLLCLYIRTFPSSNLDITFLDVGQGLSVFMKKGSNTYLIDGGGKFNSNVAKYTLIPFIKSRGIGSLDYVFVTHGDMDHIKGIRELMGEVEIGCIMVSSLAQQPKATLELIEKAAELGIEVMYFKKEDYILDGKMKVNCLYPNENQVVSSNNEASLTLEVTYEEFDMLLCGDIYRTQEMELLPYLKQYEILQVPHHGSKSSSSEGFVKLVHPDCAIISAGRNNRYGHPHNIVVETYERYDAILYDTVTNGQVRIRTDGKKYWVIPKRE